LSGVVTTEGGTRGEMNKEKTNGFRKEGLRKKKKKWPHSLKTRGYLEGASRGERTVIRMNKALERGWAKRGRRGGRGPQKESSHGQGGKNGPVG